MKKESKKKTGIMGGTFNPIHRGHIMLARTALSQYELGKVLFIPNGRPAYKEEKSIVSQEDRVAMIEASICDEPRFELSRIELERDGYTYSYETLEELHRRNPEEDYYFILGADSLFQLEHWKYPERVCRACILLLAGREQAEEDALDEQIEFLSSKYGAVVRKLSCPQMDVSSRMIRSRLLRQESIEGLVTQAAEQYIYKKHLYQNGIAGI